MSLLIATDGSTHAEAALHLARHLLVRYTAANVPTILTVIGRKADRPQAEAILSRACESVGRLAPEIQTKIRLGQSAREIIQEAEAGGYELIILGERPAHRLVTRLLGSTVTRVMEGAPCPVIIAKGKIGPISQILLCDSGAVSPSFLKRFTDLLSILAEGQVAITALHVMSQMSAGPAVHNDQLWADADELIQKQTPEGELLAQDIQLLTEAGLHPHPKVRHGLVVDEILAEAQSGDYDLVVIGAYRGTNQPRFLLDNLGRRIMAQLDRPLLIVR